MKFKNLILPILLGLFFASCVTVEKIPFAPDEKNQVPVFFDSKPDRKYLEVGYYTAYGTAFHTQKRVLRRLREKAKKDGIDALINVNITYTFLWPTVSGLAVQFVE